MIARPCAAACGGLTCPRHAPRPQHNSAYRYPPRSHKPTCLTYNHAHPHPHPHPQAPRFVWWEGKLRPVPSGLDAFTFDLMSIPGKIRAGLGAIGLINGAMPCERGRLTIWLC